MRSVQRACCVAIGVVIAVTNSAFAQNEAEYQKLIEQRASALVTVKFVLKMKMGGFGDNESEQEITGAMIDPKGIVLCSNTQLGGYAGMIRRMVGGMAGEMSATPTDLKVLIGDDTVGVEAELMARDSDLDLAWVRIKQPSDKGYAAIDLSKDAKARVGQRLLTVNRLSKYFGRAVAVNELRVAGIAQKPRELYVPGGGSAGLGLPVYNAEGALVGVTIMQMPESEDGGGNPFSALSRMSEMQSTMGGMILPAAEVLKATGRAREADSSSDAAKEDDADKPKDEEKKSDE